MLDRQQTVANIVLDHSECAAVFQRHRIDFCCSGAQPVERAAREKGVDVDALMSELDRAVRERSGAPAKDPRELSTARLVAHIVSTHHEYLRSALPFLVGLAAKVGRVHGEHNPKLRELSLAVDELSKALIAHLDEEETTLFPALMAGASATVAAPALASMTDEHLAVAKLLERIRAASDDFTLPDWACNSYRTLFAELTRLETDIFAHVHLENHVLAPRFAAQ
jgi:regulator of cell morphogenesis and NO signaling